MESHRLALLALMFASTSSLAVAQGSEPLRVVLFKTAADDNGSSELAAALDPVVSSELRSIPGVRIAASPALDLPSMQLAIDCVGETAECLRAAAQQADADGLVAPSVRRIGGDSVVTVLRYDAGRAIAMQGVSRRYSGERATEDALAGVSAMLRELFDVTPPAAQAPPPSAASLPEPAPVPATDSQPMASEPVARASRLPVLPIVLGAVGVAFIGAGIGFGVAADASEDASTKHVVPDGSSRREAAATFDRAIAEYESGETQAVIANVGFGVGAAALVAAGVLLVLHLRDEPERAPSASLQLSPQLAPHALGMELRAAWDTSL